MTMLGIHFLVFLVSCLGILLVPSEVLKGAFAGAIATELLFLATEVVENRARLGLAIWSLLHKRADVYFSVAGLLRFRSGNKLLLIYSSRRAQYQPIGGALRFSTDVKPPFDYRPVVLDRPDNQNDMRFEVRGEQVSEVVRWIYNGLDREVSPWREFYEELVQTQIVAPSLFPYLSTRLIRRVRTGPIRKGRRKNYYDVRVFEIHEVQLTDQQKQELIRIAPDVGASPDPLRSPLLWFDEDKIQSYVKPGQIRVGDHTLELL